MEHRTLLRHADEVMRTVDGSAGGAGAGADTRIARSWARCARNYHLEPDRTRAPNIIEAGALRERIQRHEELIGVAAGEMDLLYEQIAGSGYALLLTDDSGIILCQRVDPTLGKLFRGAGLLPGADWSERSEGTNGIGTCLAERRPVTVHRDEHFNASHIGLSCSGALIRDPNDEVIGVLDASCVGSHDTRESQAHTMALVSLSALVIEKCLFMQRHRQQVVLRFHWRPEFVHLVSDGAIALGRDGTVLAADRTALALLGAKTRGELIGRPVAQVFALRLDALISAARRSAPVLLAARTLAHGHRYFVSVRDGALPSGGARRTHAHEEAGVSSQDHNDRCDASPPAAPAGADDSTERSQVLTAIEQSRWNMTHAAAQLGISRNTLYRRIKQLGIPLPHARRS
jgi:transcriptional regulator of acetoin/glycerol metabolism